MLYYELCKNARIRPEDGRFYQPNADFLTPVSRPVFFESDDKFKVIANVTPWSIHVTLAFCHKFQKWIFSRKLPFFGLNSREIWGKQAEIEKQEEKEFEGGVCVDFEFDQN